jgi:hypothetical protein
MIAAEAVTDGTLGAPSGISLAGDRSMKNRCFFDGGARRARFIGGADAGRSGR